MRNVLIGLAALSLATPGICTISIDGDEDENSGAGGAPTVSDDESVEEQLGDPGEEGPVAEDGEAEESDGSADGDGSDGEDD